MSITSFETLDEAYDFLKSLEKLKNIEKPEVKPEPEPEVKPKPEPEVKPKPDKRIISELIKVLRRDNLIA